MEELTKNWEIEETNSMSRVGLRTSTPDTPALSLSDTAPTFATSNKRSKRSGGIVLIASEAKEGGRMTLSEPLSSQETTSSTLAFEP